MYGTKQGSYRFFKGNYYLTTVFEPMIDDILEEDREDKKM